MFRFPPLPELFAVTDELIGLALVILLVWWIVRMARSGRAARAAAPPPVAEEEVLRRLCDQLEKMERRLDNLETILGDKRERKER